MLDQYLRKYGVFPEFKAGLHFGDVTVGEIGVIKREFLFTGDVLNTTSRIQSMCNELHAELLISSELFKELQIDESYATEEKGVFELRGRNEKVKLIKISDAVSAGETVV